MSTHATPLARRLDGKTSEGIAHGTGPCCLASVCCFGYLIANTNPRCTEAEHVDQKHSNAGPAFKAVGWPVVGEFANQDGNDQVRKKHDHGAPQEQRPTTDPVHGPERASHTDELDAVQNTGHDELHVVFEAHRGEECRGVVYQRVDSDELRRVVRKASGRQMEIDDLPVGRTLDLFPRMSYASTRP